MSDLGLTFYITPFHLVLSKVHLNPSLFHSLSQNKQDQWKETAHLQFDLEQIWGSAHITFQTDKELVWLFPFQSDAVGEWKFSRPQQAHHWNNYNWSNQTFHAGLNPEAKTHTQRQYWNRHIKKESKTKLRETESLSLFAKTRPSRWYWHCSHTT